MNPSTVEETTVTTGGISAESDASGLTINLVPKEGGNAFKGMTDEMLRWQTARFLGVEERRDGHVVYLRPEVGAEVAFDGVQESSQYPGGVALRFARIKGYRPDKSPSEADTIETVRGTVS